MMEIIIIAAIDRNRVIGKEGVIPWHSFDELRKQELKHFRDTTIGHPVIMGRTTYESIGKPLENRLNIVLSRTLSDIEGVYVHDSFEKSLEACDTQGYDRVFVIGGQQVYEKALTVATKMLITEIPVEYDGDTYFPQWSEEDWEEEHRMSGGLFDIVMYGRRQ